METAGKIFALTLVVFLLMSLIWNILPKLPRMPWDIDLRKVGIHIYLPLLSSAVISAILTIFVFNFFR